MAKYTHWAYFKNYEQATACKASLPGYTVRIEGPTDYRADWLLRVQHDITKGLPDGRMDVVESIVARHGGEYDGGEMTLQVVKSDPDGTSGSGLLEVTTGLPVDDGYLGGLKEILGDLYTDRSSNMKGRERSG